MAAAANELPPGPFPSDGTKPCPIAWLPPDLWYHISQFVASDQASDFLIATAQSADDNTEMPLRALREHADLVLRGVPANGVLYITEVPQESGEIRETWNARTETWVNDVGPWFTKIHRHEGGRIDEDRTPIPRGVWDAPVEHSFYVEGTASHAVRLHVSDSEEQVVREWHESSELRPRKSRETRELRTRLSARRAAMQDDLNRRFLKVSGATTKACTGELTVLALCKAMKIKAKLGILGTLPLMARLDLDNPVDELSQMERPHNLKAQMAYSLGKWLVVVPAKWIIFTQPIRRRMAMHDRNAIPSIPNIREWLLQNPVYAAAFNGDARFLDRERPGGRPNPNGLKYSCTSFRTLAPLMVYAFFSCANRFVALTSDEETRRLITRAQKDLGFRQEFSVTGPHVTPAGKEGHLTVGKAGAAAPAETSPELELLGGFDGIF